MSAVSTQFLHRDRIPGTGVLVMPGRLNFEQLLQLERLFSERKITWLIEESSQHDPSLRGYLEKSDSGAMFSAIDGAPAAAGTQLLPYLENDGVLIYVPGRVAVRNATPCHIPASHLRTLCAFGLPILPIAIDCPQESSLGIEHRSSLPSSVFVIAKPISAVELSVAAYRQSLLEAAEEAFSARELFTRSLAMALFEGLRKHGSKNHLVDGADDTELPYDKVLAAAIAFSKVIKMETDQPRVAIVLPPGKSGLIANLAVLFAGKTPVNLNYTSGPEAIRSCIRQAAVDRFITADPFVRKISAFPWPPNRDLILIDRILPTLKSKIFKWTVLTKLLPVAMIGAILRLNKRRGDDEAVLLFTSGSADQPKGVILSHRNVLANVTQFGSRLDLPMGSTILGCLPLFHSFGCTVTLWFPVIEGINLVTYPSPLETKRLAELIALHQINVFLSTPTFLRGYMKRIDPAQLSSLTLVVTGAEKLPQSLADAFEEKFDVRPQEGYGLTETSPGANVNLPDPEPENHAITLPSSRPGSVGQLLPGLAIKITDPASDKMLPIHQQGIIWFKGANVFCGYLGDPQKTSDVLHDGWFRTGDVGRVDDDGFLYIEGRISRFSKIAGEMVPHEAIESAINQLLGLDGETERKIAIIGVPDAHKGEAILLLSTLAESALEQECLDLRYKLLDKGIPSLWCPKHLLAVSEIPVLASGKLDIKGCQALVKRGRGD